MSYPTLVELPPPPPGKTGWPWTEDSSQLPDIMPDGSHWPRISIVTPSYNQGQFIEETIRSVLLQGYPNLEYIIIDGGSTDVSVEIIKKYEPWLSYWVSEPDRGQSHAINKGFAQTTGEIMAWINSDDTYETMALSHIVDILHAHPDAMWVAGVCHFVREDGTIIKTWNNNELPNEIEYWFAKSLVKQPSVFWRRYLWEQCGPIDVQYQYCFDYDLWLKFAAIQSFPIMLDIPIATFRYHPSSKTCNDLFYFSQEEASVRKSNANQLLHTKKQLTRALYYRNLFEARALLNQALSSGTNYTLGRRVMFVVQAFFKSPKFLLQKLKYSKIRTLL